MRILKNLYVFQDSLFEFIEKDFPYISECENILPDYKVDIVL